jgi:formylmethanofuran dehydrogenase subunit B
VVGDKPLSLRQLGQFAAPDDCSLARRRFAACSHVGNDDSADIDWDRLLTLVTGATTPTIGGTIIDVQTARAAIRLAADLRGVIDVCGSSSEAAFGGVMEREGYVGATLAEMDTRADSVVLIGPVRRELPRLLSRFFSGRVATGDKPRRMMVLGHRDPEDDLEIPAAWLSPEGKLIDQLAATRSALRHGTDDQPLADWLRSADYTAFLWSRDTLGPLEASMVAGLVDQLNEDRRAVMIPVAESATFRNVASWLTGLAGPLDFRDLPPITCQPAAMLGGDLRIWLQPFPDSPPPPDDRRPLIVIGAADAALVRRSDIYLRTAVPGIEAAGTTFRGDGTVTLRMESWCETPFPHADAVLREIAVGVLGRRRQRC